MSYRFNHVHLKSPTPDATIKFYMENFGATIKSTMPGGYRLDMGGTQVNITEKQTTQNHVQHYGIEHLAVTTDDYEGSLAKLRANGVEILEELKASSGKRICFLAAPDGAQVEIIEN